MTHSLGFGERGSFVAYLLAQSSCSAHKSDSGSFLSGTVHQLSQDGKKANAKDSGGLVISLLHSSDPWMFSGH